ncbi:MAG: agmatinase family protein [Sphingobacteriaceae bacterium]|nr:agmatinase family protein [Sphingobacteriaceae bacterium]
MTKSEKIKNFDPNGVGQLNDGMFGLPFTLEECETVLIPVPWEVTVSYSGGTVNGPKAILDASYQVDLYDPLVKDAWKKGIAMDKINNSIKQKSNLLRKSAERYIEELANGKNPESPKLKSQANKIQKECLALNKWVKEKCLHFLNQNKTVGLIGGDHSTPLGMMQALAEKFGNYTILQIDAHADLRIAYEGFEFSHASIMYNALKIKEIDKLVQVGIRDYCEEELEIIQNSKGRIVTFFDRDIKYKMFNGDSWDRICNRIVNELPQNIYLSFDIDGLDPKLCPNTGTPVAGGFETEQILFLFEKIVKSGRKIIAFDLNEVTPGKNNDWDANVAARLLYRICNLVASSQNK